MTAAAEGPAVQRRRLRVDLRKLRSEAQFTQRDVAKVMEWSPSKLIRIENGDVGISSNDLKALLAHYGVTQKQQVERFLSMARNARKESWTEFRSFHSSEFLTYLSYESSSALLREFEIVYIPGLLQTEEYARALWRDVYHEDDETMDARWEARQRRQELHEASRPPQMFFVMDEATIRRTPGGPNVMRRQLTQLKDWAQEPHVTVQILPFTRGAHPGMTGPFIVLEFPNPEDDDLVYLEFATGESVSRDDPEATSDYVERFYELEDLALSHDDSIGLIDDAIAQLDGRNRTTAPTGKTDPTDDK